MRVRAYYNEYIKPKSAEEITNNIEYFSDNIPIMITDITKSKEGKEFIKGLKDVEIKIVAKIERDIYDAVTNDVKVKDRVFIFGKEYRVIAVDEIIDNEKFARKIARNSNLYDKYVKKVVILI